MKKLFLFLILAVAVLMIFCSCGKSIESDTSESVSETEIQNKGESVDKNDFESVVGNDVELPENAVNENYYIIEQDSDRFGQVTFEKNNADFVLRVVDSNEFSDISGLYYNWNSTKDCTVNGCEAEIHLFKSDDDSCSVIIWFDSENSKMYSLSSDSVVKEDALIELASEI